jgi:hypothetical protein
MNLTKGSASAISSLPNLGVYKEHVIYQPLIDCYDRAGHLLECLIPARCNPTSQTTHTARCGVMADCHTTCESAKLAAVGMGNRIAKDRGEIALSAVMMTTWLVQFCPTFGNMRSPVISFHQCSALSSMSCKWPLPCNSES